MFRTVRPFLIALGCSWIALFAAALLYSNLHPQSHWIMTAALPALMVEAIFYLASGFHETRVSFALVDSHRAKAGILWVSALLPYLLYSLLTGTFERNAFYLLAFLCGILAFWYAVLPRRFAYDAGFLIVAAAPVILRVFQRIYFSPDGHTRADILGHLMWIRLGIAAFLILREWDPGPFSFWPTAQEWRVGILLYVLAVVPLVALAMLIHDVRFAPLSGEWWRSAAVAIGTFFGTLWVIAFGEELFFRGVVERAIVDTSNSRVAAVVISAAVYGAAHLWFHAFPDWRPALVASLLGVACGIAYLKTGSVRAPMVTHAFVVATWRVFFK